LKLVLERKAATFHNEDTTIGNNQQPAGMTTKRMTSIPVKLNPQVADGGPLVRVGSLSAVLS
jgi:hypothetical protein